MVTMPLFTCVCCLRKTSDSHHFCGLCRLSLPHIFQRLIDGESIVANFDSRYIEAYPELYYPGTWTKDNWQEYPTVLKLRGTKTEPKEDDHAGQIYNPITESWSWF